MIDVEGLRFTYPGAPDETLRGLDFNVREGEVFGFLGPSGVGKSTTQRILTGVLGGWSGSVRVRGRRLQELGAGWRERIGVSFEYPNVYGRLTAAENLRFFASLYGGPTATPEELLEMVGLEDVADARVSTFSRGMKMRLNLCRAFLSRPELVFLDEPTSGQDPANARRVKDLVRRVGGEGKTVVLATHDMTAAAELCDRVAFLVDGRIPVIDSPRDLTLRAGRAVVRVEYREDASLARREFALEGLGDDPAFLDLLHSGRVEAIHTLEATLEDVFLEVTGRRLT